MLPSSQQFGGRPLKHAVKVTTLAAVPKQMERQRSTEATQMAEVAERARARASCQIQNSETLGELLSRRLARSDQGVRRHNVRRTPKFRIAHRRVRDIARLGAFVHGWCLGGDRSTRLHYRVRGTRGTSCVPSGP